MSLRPRQSNGKQKKGNDGQQRRTKSSTKSSEAMSDEVPTPLPPRVFLYIQLHQISRLPETKCNLELHLQVGDKTIVKMQEKYNIEAIIYQEEFEQTPTFTLILQQDNVDDLNYVSDHPLLVRLYQRINVPEHLFEEGVAEEFGTVEDQETQSTDKKEKIITKIKGSILQQPEEDVSTEYADDEDLQLISIGYLDILKFFAKRRTMLTEEVLLYPVLNIPEDLRITTRTEWHLYTLLPLLKDISFRNMAFISLESIYGVKDWLLEMADDLAADISFRSNTLNEDKSFDVYKLCTFSRFKCSQIADQYFAVVFETLKSPEFGKNPSGLKTNMQVSLHTILMRLLRNEGFEFDTNHINMALDEALICNSVHRFVLTQEINSIIEEAVALNQYHLYMTVYKRTDPDIILMDGQFDMHILLYPEMNSCRFAVNLNSLETGRRSTWKQRKSRLHSQSWRSSQYGSKIIPFAIVKICLFSALGDEHEELIQFNESFVNQDRLASCGAPMEETVLAPLPEIVEENYRCFDEYIDEIITFIACRNITSPIDNKPHFCCVLQNLINVLLKLVGCDYNVRVPTTNNIEFTNLLCTVYNDLERRIHNKVEEIEHLSLEAVITDFDQEQLKVIEYMTMIKYCNEIGEFELAELLSRKIRLECKSPAVLNFYVCIYHMERRNFEEAKQYLRRPTHEKDLGGEYFAGWIQIYIQYMERLEDVTENSTSFEKLLTDLTDYGNNFPKDPEAWSLLYCYYKRCGYHAGMSYARYRYENLYDKPHKEFAYSPRSLFGIYMNYEPNLVTKKAKSFMEAAKIFARIGLYEFASTLFEEIELECSEVVRYLVKTTLKVLMKNVEPGFKVRTFPTDNSPLGMLLYRYQAQVNGNLEYYNGNETQAQLHYVRNLTLPENEFNQFVLGFLRLGVLSTKAGDCETTILALDRIFNCEINRLIIDYIAAKALYKLGQLQNALDRFASCTTHKMHVPDIWGYLALVNLRLGKNYHALECWKQAKCDPRNIINDDVYNELSKINYDDVDIYVDIPVKQPKKQMADGDHLNPLI